jgi:hypothetical protein
MGGVGGGCAVCAVLVFHLEFCSVLVWAVHEALLGCCFEGWVLLWSVSGSFLVLRLGLFVGLFGDDLGLRVVLSI